MLSLTAQQKTRIYAAYNVGIGTLFKLEAGNYDSGVERMVSYQASALAAGGPSEYLDRIQDFLV
jgi:hypothetical protein